MALGVTSQMLSKIKERSNSYNNNFNNNSHLIFMLHLNQVSLTPKVSNLKAGNMQSHGETIHLLTYCLMEHSKFANLWPSQVPQIYTVDITCTFFCYYRSGHSSSQLSTRCRWCPISAQWSTVTTLAVGRHCRFCMKNASLKRGWLCGNGIVSLFL